MAKKHIEYNDIKEEGELTDDEETEQSQTRRRFPHRSHTIVGDPDQANGRRSVGRIARTSNSLSSRSERFRQRSTSHRSFSSSWPKSSSISQNRHNRSTIKQSYSISHRPQTTHKKENTKKYLTNPRKRRSYVDYDKVDKESEENNLTFDMLLVRHKETQAKLEAVEKDETKTNENFKESGSSSCLREVKNKVSKVQDDNIDDNIDEELSELQLRHIALASATNKNLPSPQDTLSPNIHPHSLSKSPDLPPAIQQTSSLIISEPDKDNIVSKKKLLNTKHENSLKIASLLTHSNNRRNVPRAKTRKRRQLLNQKSSFNMLLKKPTTYNRFMAIHDRRIEAADIRQIRDYDEKYDRFMKFVKVNPSEKPPSIYEQIQVSSPYRYDNYDEVAMDVVETSHSESSSLVSPSQLQGSTNMLAPFIEQQQQQSTDMMPQEQTGLKNAAPNGNRQHSERENDDDDDDDMAKLRQQLLKSMASKRAMKAATSVTTTSNFKIDSIIQSSDVIPKETKKTQASVLAASKISPILETPKKLGASKPVKKIANNYPSPPLNLKVIPRHKRVIINLGEDSESNSDQEDDGGELFNGLDKFIKDARKSVEKASLQQLHKLPSTEIPPREIEIKEGPLKTPEILKSLPDSHKEEYLRLKQEIVKREKIMKIQQLHRQQQPKPQLQQHFSGTPSPPAHVSAGSSLSLNTNDISVENGKIEEKEYSLITHRQEMQSSRNVLEKLNRQLQLKNEALKATLDKTRRLKEQLSSVEKIMNANKALVKRLVYQKSSVEENLKNQCQKEEELEEKLADLMAQSNSLSKSSILTNIRTRSIGNVLKRKIDKTAEIQPVKKLKTNKFAEKTMKTQKKTADFCQEKLQLQKLEKQYAERLNKLKENRKIEEKNQVVLGVIQKNIASRRTSRTANTSNSAVLLPKPALLEYKKDKLLVHSSHNGDGTDSSGEEPPGILSKNPIASRRKSLLDLNSSTKPDIPCTGHVLTPTSPLGENLNKSATTVNNHGATDKDEASQLNLPHMPGTGTQLESIKLLQKERENSDTLHSLFQTFLSTSCPSEVNGGVSCLKLNLKVSLGAFLNQQPTEEAEENPYLGHHSFTYQSPLHKFKSYRFSPFFRTKSHLSLSSLTFSNRIEPKLAFCRFDLLGTCSDKNCQWQHHADIFFSQKEPLYKDLVSYAPDVTGFVAGTDSLEDLENKLTFYVESICKQNHSRLSREQMCLLLISKVNDYSNHVAPHTTFINQRLWKPTNKKKTETPTETQTTTTKTKTNANDKEEELSQKGLQLGNIVPNESMMCDDTFCEDDQRYFNTSAVISAAELEDIVMENPNNIQLWLKLAYKHLNSTNSEIGLNKALNILSRGLEANRNSVELWKFYLKLFKKGQEKEELMKMYQLAIKSAPSYELYWKWLSAEDTYSHQMEVCKRTLDFLWQQQERDFTSRNSHYLLEMLLYCIQLNLQTNRRREAINIFQNALKQSSVGHTLSAHLTLDDLCVAWLSYIYVLEFQCLPPSLFDSSVTNPSRIVLKEEIIFPWTEKKASKATTELFLEGIETCGNRCNDEKSIVKVCLSFYKNLIQMERMRGRYNVAEEICRQALEINNDIIDLWNLLAEIKLELYKKESVKKVYEEIFAVKSPSAQLYHQAACLSIARCEPTKATIYLLNKCAASFFYCHTSGEVVTEAKLLYSQLLGQPLPTNYQMKHLADHVSAEMVKQEQFYLWLCYCLYLQLCNDHSATTNAYEAALCVVQSTSDLHTLWLEFLQYRQRLLVSSKSNGKKLKDFVSLVYRCFSTVPVQFPMPLDPSRFYTDYTFHNHVVDLFVRCFHPSSLPGVYEELLLKMPTNHDLVLRSCEAEFLQNNLCQARRVYSTFLLRKRHCYCLPLWKIAISLELVSSNYCEVRSLYRKATQALPFNGSLWTDYLLFELAHSDQPEVSSTSVQSIIDHCCYIGVYIKDFLETLLK